MVALNILLAVIVFVGVVGLLAFSIFAARAPAEPKGHTETTRARATGRVRSVAQTSSLAATPGAAVAPSRAR